MRKKRSSSDEDISVNRPQGYTCGLAEEPIGEREEMLSSDPHRAFNYSRKTRPRRFSNLTPRDETPEELQRQMRQYSRNRYRTRLQNGGSRDRPDLRSRNIPRWESGNKLHFCYLNTGVTV